MQNVMEKVVDMERRITKQESNRGSSLRYAEVTEVDKKGHARVRLLDGDEMVTLPLRTLQRRTLKDKDQRFPDVGEHVACLFAGQGFESGVILGAMYSDKITAPDEDAHYGFYRYEDGTTIYYDREKHKYIADVKGDIELTCEKSVKATVEEDVSVEAKGDVTVSAEGRLILEGGAGIVMRGPSIRFEGYKGGACKAHIEADIHIKGLVDHLGNRIQTGNEQVSGNITASGVISGNPVYGCNH